MRKLVLTSALIFATVISVVAQVGIGTTTPNSSSVLDLTSTNKAFIPPRMTTAQRNSIATPAAGMMIFNTDSTCVEIYRVNSWYNICTGKSSAAGLPPIDGLTSSNQVAASNLIAYWPFDANNKEQGSGVAALSGGTYNVGTVTYTAAGKIGNCATFTNGALVYPSIGNINHDTALQSYSLSMWVKMPTASGAEGLRSLFQVNGNRFPDLWGLVTFELSNNGVAGDSLALQTRQVQVDGTGPHNVVAGPINTASGGSSNWTFITETYNGNGTNQTMKIYANGVLKDSVEFTDVDKSVSSTQSTFRVVPTGNGAVTTPTPANMVTIGTFNFNDFPEFQGGDGYGNVTPTAASRPWAQNGITGAIDDVRLFNTPLTAQQVSDLYQLGNQGR